MHIIRPVGIDDEVSLNQLATLSTTGLLTLPRSPQRLKQKISDSLSTFAAAKFPYKPGKYFFILENLKDRSVRGCCAIHFDAGTPGEEYYYKYDSEQRLNLSRHALEEQKLLVPQLSPIENTSEVCTLFLSPESQQSGLGRLLSLSRFLFIACHRERFQKYLMAELRGVIDPAGVSAFWEAVGRHFCNLSFEEFTALYESNELKSKDVVASYPLYYALLPQEAQQVVGHAHTQSKAALKMLEKEGLLRIDGVDVLDAGPKLLATIANLRIIKSSKQAPVLAIIDENQPQESLKPQLVCNLDLNFRACYGEVSPLADQQGVAIDRHTASALDIKVGDTICFIDAKPASD